MLLYNTFIRYVNLKKFIDLKQPIYIDQKI